MTHTTDTRLPYSNTLLAVIEERIKQHATNPPPSDATEAVKAAHAAKLRRLRLAAARVRGNHTPAEWDAIVAETGGICVRCGYDHFKRGLQPCKGYVIPLTYGGSNAADNLQPLCKSCVSAKEGERINWLEFWRANKPPLDTEKTNA